MRAKTKRFLRFLLVLCVVILVAAGVYVAYIFLSYSRIEDNQNLEVTTTGSYSYFQDNEAMNSGRVYSILTYNIGFGAYTDDYSFFMDGGKSSWASSEEGLMSNICEIANVINLSDADFVFLQEVDLDGTRTYHVNEMELINQFLKGYYISNAVCFDSKFLMYPLTQPHGANTSAQVTYSSFPISSSVRRSLPIADDFAKVFDYDRCYIKTTVPTAKEKDLILYNVHLSAYTDDLELKKAQIDMLLSDMEEEYKKGNYVVCGGDFNQNLRDEEDNGTVPSWAGRFPRELLPEGFSMGIDHAKPEHVTRNTCRDANEPYNPDTTFTVTADGFIVSNNVRVHFYNNTDWGYRFSDHDPVLMQFFLKD